MSLFDFGSEEMRRAFKLAADQVLAKAMSMEPIRHSDCHCLLAVPHAYQIPEDARDSASWADTLAAIRALPT